MPRGHASKWSYQSHGHGVRSEWPTSPEEEKGRPAQARGWTAGNHPLPQEAVRTKGGVRRRHKVEMVDRNGHTQGYTSMARPTATKGGIMAWLDSEGRDQGPGAFSRPSAGSGSRCRMAWRRSWPRSTSGSRRHQRPLRLDEIDTNGVGSVPVSFDSSLESRLKTQWLAVTLQDADTRSLGAHDEHGTSARALRHLRPSVGNALALFCSRPHGPPVLSPARMALSVSCQDCGSAPPRPQVPHNGNRPLLSRARPASSRCQPSVLLGRRIGRPPSYRP
jgi:hypothetical protein